MSRLQNLQSVERYSFSRAWGQFTACNALSWAYLGTCTFEETLAYLQRRSSGLPTILHELMENKKYRNYKRAINVLLTILHAKLTTTKQENVTFYGIELPENADEKQTINTLMSHKKRFKTDFLNFVMSFRKPTEEKINKREFNEQYIIELIGKLAKRCNDKGFNKYSEALYKIIPSKENTNS